MYIKFAGENFFLRLIASFWSVLVGSVFAQALVVAPNPINFGTQLVQSTANLAVTISNFGANPVSVSSLNVSPGTGFTRSGGTCPTTYPSVIAAGTSCTVSVQFAATIAGTVTGSLNIVADTGNSATPITATVVGSGTPPTPSVTTLDFGLAANGNAISGLGAAQSLTFTNNTATAVDLVSVSGAPYSVALGFSTSQSPTYAAASNSSCLSSPAPGFFSLIPSLAPGASCTLSIFPAMYFQSTGVYNTTMTLVTSAGNTTVNLKAKIGPITYPIVVSPASLNLTRASISTATSVGTVTLSNPAPVVATIGAIVVPAPFQRVGGTCPSMFPAQLAVGASCTVTLHVPAGAGAATPLGTDYSKAALSADAPIISDTGNVSVTLNLDTTAANGDTDNDGIPDAVEVAEGRNPNVKDNMLFAGQHANSNRWFAMQQYRDFLGREAEAQGLTDWTTLLNANRLSREAVIQGFFGSPEFQLGVPSVVRLYLGFFNRIPDSSGLKGWVTAWRTGTPIAAIASSFARSAEFTQTYGTLTDAQFVTLVYRNVLGRAPDSAGNAGWLAQLRNGASRGDVMVGFTESKEFQLQSAPNVFVIMMYEAMLRRAAEPAGYAFWVDYINRGSDALEITRGFLGAQEYRNRFLP